MRFAMVAVDGEVGVVVLVDYRRLRCTDNLAAAWLLGHFANNSHYTTLKSTP